MLHSRILPIIIVLGSVSVAGQTQTTIFGAGSTFVSPIMSKWAEEYQKVHPDIRISYLANGSGAGIGMTLNGMIDFGGTDAPSAMLNLLQQR